MTIGPISFAVGGDKIVLLAYIFAPPFKGMGVCLGGGIGRRARLKIVCLRACGFDSHPGYNNRYTAQAVHLTKKTVYTETIGIPVVFVFGGIYPSLFHFQESESRYNLPGIGT